MWSAATEVHRGCLNTLKGGICTQTPGTFCKKPFLIYNAKETVKTVRKGM